MKRESELPRTGLQKEVAVHKKLLTILASVALVVAGTAAAGAASAHQKRIGHRAAHSSSDITSFSSSSELHVGVNHPPKNR